MATTDAPLTVEERYVSATHASNLRVQSERGGSADVIIAAGMSPARLGAALLRLHSEFDSAEKPRRMQREAIEVLAQTLPRLPNKALDTKTAHKTAHAWHLHELKILMGKLKTLPAVRINLVAWASMNLMADADKRVAEVLIWWLNHVCLVCEGRGKEKIPGTPSLSHRDCRDCHGTGETPIPRDADAPESMAYIRGSKMLLSHINGCVHTARVSIRTRLHGARKIKTQGWA